MHHYICPFVWSRFDLIGQMLEAIIVSSECGYDNSSFVKPTAVPKRMLVDHLKGLTICINSNAQFLMHELFFSD